MPRCVAIATRRWCWPTRPSRSTAPLMFAALGPSGVGKTVYLGMLLDMLSRQPKELQLSARGGFSVTLQQTTLAALSRCEFPSKTPSEPTDALPLHTVYRLRIAIAWARGNPYLPPTWEAHLLDT